MDGDDGEAHRIWIDFFRERFRISASRSEEELAVLIEAVLAAVRKPERLSVHPGSFGTRIRLLDLAMLVLHAAHEMGMATSHATTAKQGLRSLPLLSDHCQSHCKLGQSVNIASHCGVHLGGVGAGNGQFAFDPALQAYAALPGKGIVGQVLAGTAEGQEMHRSQAFGAPTQVGGDEQPLSSWEIAAQRTGSIGGAVSGFSKASAGSLLRLRTQIYDCLLSWFETRPVWFESATSVERVKEDWPVLQSLCQLLSIDPGLWEASLGPERSSVDDIPREVAQALRRTSNQEWRANPLASETAEAKEDGSRQVPLAPRARTLRSGSFLLRESGTTGLSRSPPGRGEAALRRSGSDMSHHSKTTRKYNRTMSSTSGVRGRPVLQRPSTLRNLLDIIPATSEASQDGGQDVDHYGSKTSVRQASLPQQSDASHQSDATALCRPLSEALKQSNSKRKGCMDPSDTAGLDGAVSQEGLDERWKLLRLLLGSEVDRIATWHNPLQLPYRSLPHEHFFSLHAAESVSPVDPITWLAAVETAWKINPSLALHLPNRFAHVPSIRT